MKKAAAHHEWSPLMYNSKMNRRNLSNLILSSCLYLYDGARESIGGF
jgi:hypothetical protein